MVTDEVLMLSFLARANGCLALTLTYRFFDTRSLGIERSANVSVPERDESLPSAGRLKSSLITWPKSFGSRSGEGVPFRGEAYTLPLLPRQDLIKSGTAKVSEYRY